MLHEWLLTQALQTQNARNVATGRADTPAATALAATAPSATALAATAPPAIAAPATALVATDLAPATAPATAATAPIVKCFANSAWPLTLVQASFG